MKLVKYNTNVAKSSVFGRCYFNNCQINPASPLSLFCSPLLDLQNEPTFGHLQCLLHNITFSTAKLEFTVAKNPFSWITTRKPQCRAQLYQKNLGRRMSVASAQPIEAKIWQGKTITSFLITWLFIESIKIALCLVGNVRRSSNIHTQSSHWLEMPSISSPTMLYSMYRIALLPTASKPLKISEKHSYCVDFSIYTPLLLKQ